jgi:DNA replication protein DnaC
MPAVLDRLATYTSGQDNAAREAWIDALGCCRVLLLDEAHIVLDNDRGRAMLLTIIDKRVSHTLPTFLALNGRWDELRASKSKLVQQVREKLAGVTREVLCPGASLRETWTFEN